MNRNVVLGSVLAATVAVGVLVGLLLIAPDDPTPAGVGSPDSVVPSGAPTGTTLSATAQAADSSEGLPADGAVAVAAQAIADAITEADSLKFGLLTCDQQSTAELTRLQQKWDAAGPVTATVRRPPVVTGDRGSVTIRVKGAGGEKTTDFPLRKKDTKWCVPG